MSVQKVEFETFKYWYQNLYYIWIYDMYEMHDGEYYKFAVLVTKDGVNTVYDVKMMTDAKKIISSVSTERKPQPSIFEGVGVKINFPDQYEKISPFEDGFNFGPPMPAPAPLTKFARYAELFPDYYFNYYPYATNKDVIADLQKNGAIKIEELTINNFDVIKYIEIGMFEIPIMIVFGKDYNYHLSGNGRNIEKEFAYFTKVIEGMELK